MAERDSRTQKEIEEFVLVNNEKNSTFMERNVFVRPIAMGKQGPVFEVTNRSNERIGIVADDKKFKFDEKYKMELMKKMGPYFKQLALDSSELEADVMAMIEKQREKDKQKQEEQRRQQLIREEEIRNRNNSDVETKKNKEIDGQERKNSEKQETVELQDNNVMSKEEIEKHPNADILDRKLARKLISDIDKYDFYSVKVVEINGRPKVYVKNNESNDYEVVPTYIDAKPEFGATDSFEYGTEKQDIERGNVMTFLDTNGEILRLDARITNTGEIEVRQELGDVDQDGDREGGLVETKTNKTVPTASKVKDASDENDRILDGKEKEDLGLQSDDILTNQQIKDIFEEEDITEDERRRVIGKIEGEIKYRDLKELIDQERGKNIESNDEQDRDDDWDTGFDYEAWKRERSRR